MLNYLTVGKPSRVIWSFSLPLLLSTALQQIYNIANSIIVGRFAGNEGLASIGAAYPITLFFIAVATGSTMGSSVIISQLFGAQKLSRMKSAVYTAIISLGILGVFMACLGMALSRTLMTLLNANGDIYEGAVSYLFIYSVGVIPMFAYNTATAVFTGLGDSRRPLYFLLLSSVLNIMLAYISVRYLRLGVIGAAWSTVISQTVAAVLSLSFMTGRLREVAKGERVCAFDKKLFLAMSNIAVPSIVQQATVALAHTVVQSLVNTLGTSVVAGYEAAAKIHNFAYMSFNTLGIALSSFTAQNLGAGHIGRIKKGFKSSTLICFILTAVVIAVFQIFPKSLISLFVKAGTSGEVIKVGVNYLRIISPDYLLICFVITTGGLLRGVGKVNIFLIMTLTDFAIRVSMCFILTKALGSYTGLFWAWYFGTAADLALCPIAYRYIVKQGILREH
jgi:putative MATE family efflux protein